MTKEYRLEHKEKWYEAARKYYKTHKELIKQKSIKLTAERKAWFKQFKSTLKCKICGENHPATLDFHHRNKNDKIRGLSSVVAHGWSQKRILDEVAKCDVLCANCHRKEHYNDSVSER